MMSASHVGCAQILPRLAWFFNEAVFGNGVWVRMKRLTSPRVAVFIVFVASLFMSIMDGTIVNVALSTISRDFGVNIAATDVIVVAYLVSLAVTIPVAGWVGD